LTGLVWAAPGLALAAAGQQEEEGLHLEDATCICICYQCPLSSLNELISAQSMSQSGVASLSSYVPSIWDQLYRHTECTEEGTR
jgi:hypothetical protein